MKAGGVNGGGGPDNEAITANHFNTFWPHKQPQLEEIWSKTLIEKIIFEGPITDPEKTAKSFCRL